MKIVLLFEKYEKKEIVEVINHFIAYGCDDIILFARNLYSVFSKQELEYYYLNGINLVCVNYLESEGTSKRLSFVKGSLTDKFLLVYSNEILNFDIDNVLKNHNSGGNLATTFVYENKMVCCMLENEIFDYMEKQEDFEKEVLERVGQDNEIRVVYF